MLESFPKGEDVVREIEEKMRAYGVHDISTPKGDPPRSLTELDTTALGPHELESLYAQYTAYSQFVGTVLAKREVVLKAEENRLKLTKAHVDKTLMQAGKTKAEIAALKESHPDIESVLRDILVARAERDLVEAVAKAYAAQAKALSRIIEIRKLEFEQTGRAGNMQYPSGPRRHVRQEPIQKRPNPMRHLSQKREEHEGEDSDD